MAIAVDARQELHDAGIEVLHKNGILTNLDNSAGNFKFDASGRVTSWYDPIFVEVDVVRHL